MRRSFLVTAFALAAAPAAAQGTAPAPGTTAPGMPMRLAPGHVYAKRLIGRDLYSSDNVAIGEIEDLILDPQGRVVSVVVEVETRLGFTDKYVTVPFAQVTMGGADRRATVAMTREQMRTAPGFRYED